MPKVLSTMRATPFSRAAWARASRSGMLRAGLPMDSTHQARVFSSVRAKNSSGRSSREVKRTSMPSLFRVTLNWLKVPP